MDAGRALDALVAKHVMHDVPGQVWDREYSTDIAAAWAVVEQLATRGLTLALYHSSRGSMVQTSATDPDSLHRAATMPLAICLAALHAVGAEVPA